MDVTIIIIGIICFSVAFVIFMFLNMLKKAKKEVERFKLIKQTTKEHRFEYLDTYYFYINGEDVDTGPVSTSYNFYYLVRDLDDKQLYLVSDFEGIEVSDPNFHVERNDVKLAEYHSQGSFWIDNESVCNMEIDGKKLRLSLKRYDRYKYDYKLTISDQKPKMVSQSHILYNRNEENSIDPNILKKAKFVDGFLEFDNYLNKHPEKFLSSKANKEE